MNAWGEYLDRLSLWRVRNPPAEREMNWRWLCGEFSALLPRQRVSDLVDVKMAASTTPPWAERCGFHRQAPDWTCYTCRFLADRWRPRKADEMKTWAQTRTASEEEREWNRRATQALMREVNDHEEALQRLGHRWHWPHGEPVPAEPTDHVDGQTCPYCRRYFFTFCTSCAEAEQADFKQARGVPGQYP